MDADCLLPWKSVLPWSRPEISHAPTLSMYGHRGLVVGGRSSTLWFEVPYIIWVNLNHSSLYSKTSQTFDNAWPFWEDFAISLEIIFIPAGAPEYSWNIQASRFLATLLQDQSLFLESEDWPYWESEGSWDYWQNHWKMWEKHPYLQYLIHPNSGTNSSKLQLDIHKRSTDSKRNSQGHFIKEYIIIMN